MICCRKTFKLIVMVTALGAPLGAAACEPILPLTQLMGGAGLAGPWLILNSLTWLGIAIVVKSASFVLLERRLTRWQALSYMLIGNVLSTIPGLVIAVFAGALTLLSLPLIFGLGWLVGKRLLSFPMGFAKKRPTGIGVAFGFTGAFMASVIMFVIAGGALDSRDFASYWVLKVLFAGIAVSLGMAISAVLEEYAIGMLAGRAHRKASFYPSVIRANYITLGLIMLVAAVQMLPKRLSAPNFIVSWIDGVSSILGPS